MKTKWIFLIILLALPVLIYLFLQSFGKNKFDIPIYYEAGLETVLEGCDTVSTDTTYLVTHTSNSLLGRSVVYGFITGTGYSTEEVNNIQTFMNRYMDSTQVVFVPLTSDIMLTQTFGFEGVATYVVSRENILSYARCELQVDLEYDMDTKRFINNQLVLCDNQRRIRGYYKINELKEIDRLNTELEILLNQSNE
jgi:protein SCO1/2